MSQNFGKVVDKNVIEGTRYFISLVELGSYTAVKNYYSVEISTVRNKLELLESYLGVKLTRPSRNKIDITDCGKKYYLSCSKLYTDLQNTILSSKYNGIDKLKYIRLFGTRSFVEYILPNIHQIDDKCEYTFTSDTYLFDQTASYLYQLCNYDIALIAAKDLEKIDQDNWVVCATVDSISLPSKIYVNQELMSRYDLTNNPENVFNLPFILRGDHTAFSLNVKIKGKTTSKAIENIRYIVEDDNYKVMLIEQGLGAGILLDNYSQISKSDIVALDNIISETFHEKVVVIVSKYISNKTKIIKFLRRQVDSYVNTILKA
ncbi:LysR family transcriptional regulator [Francisella philomiragia]|uniref:LysR family transcriptional regulator n=1 Tax=Francisella philomiragia TaxID=28110 RepID=UPI001C9D9F9B|nr:LysR family transcriptional regulator [Francisella philomiragia]MBY7734537.1 LysR family transcriptional regulator [Francisella philomiragia]